MTAIDDLHTLIQYAPPPTALGAIRHDLVDSLHRIKAWTRLHQMQAPYVVDQARMLSAGHQEVTNLGYDAYAALWAIEQQMTAHQSLESLADPAPFVTPPTQPQPAMRSIGLHQLSRQLSVAMTTVHMHIQMYEAATSSQHTNEQRESLYMLQQEIALYRQIVMLLGDEQFLERITNAVR